MALPAGTRERQLKRWSAHKKLALIAGDLKSLHSLAKRMRGHRPAQPRQAGRLGCALGLGAGHRDQAYECELK
jgi:hypothetical protein